jgi:RNA polymerase sigma-70 factor (ECF subfamily)
MSEISRDEWERSYRAEFPRVYRALLAVLRSRDAAFDATQDAFTEGLRRPPERQDNIAGWLFRVALRSARRGPYRTLFIELHDIVLPPKPDSDLAAVLDRMEVTRLLSMLTERQRGMVVAEYYLGLDQEEIAALFGVKRGTVAATLAHARTRMRTGGQNVR